MRLSCRGLLCVVLLSACQSADDPPPSGGKRSGADEDTDALCSNGDDDDSDSYTDCADPDCLNSPAVSVCRQGGGESTYVLCHDTQDNDNDGFADCDDPDCELAGCFENTDEACADEIDNDDNGYLDCDDFSCLYGCGVTICGGSAEKSDEECSDGIDNDGDNHMDCDDFGCRDCAAACQAGLGENTAALCSDGDDNDGDTKIDCQDDECSRLEEELDGCDTGEEDSEEECSDGEDNDNDPWIDCADRDCSGLGDCAEDTADLCSDGLDNDGDRYVDCQDWDCEELPSCVSQEASDADCSDEQDNDGDSYVDCDDFDCKFGCAVTVCGGPSEKTEEECTDDIDNDDDDHLDCDDMTCQECAVACGGGGGGEGTPEDTEELCEDGEDNDLDGAEDCQDPGCVGEHPDCNTGEVLCDDDIDNDNDPWTDCADRDCEDDPACEENTNDKCEDGLDNDGDTFLDCDDFGCSQNLAVTVCGTPAVENSDALCDDGLDNDNDTKIDCLDTNCSNDPSLEVCPDVLVTTIAAIQDPAHAEHVTFPAGQTRVRVKLENITVTTPLLTDRDGKHTFFVQDAFPPADTRYHGIEVYAGTAAPEIAPGQQINLVGFYKEFHGLSEIQFGKLTVLDGEPVVTAPTNLTTQDLATPELAEPYEGVLVQITAAEVSEIDVESEGGDEPPTDDFAVIEASAPGGLVPLVVSTKFAPNEPVVGTVFGFLVGAVTFDWDQFRLAPRVAADYGPPDASPDDDDDDGLTNSQEELLGTNTQDEDSDGDGEDDLAEVVDAAVPADSDCDSNIDALERSDEDTDGDGSMDELDWADHDGPTADPDGDGDPNSTDPNDDNDNYCDPGIGAPINGVCTQIGDNCPTLTNNNQANDDSDALGDACDADVDGDEICNPQLCLPVAAQCEALDDNCQFLGNPDQADLDGDQKGDDCDADDDNDLVCDPGEVSPSECNALGGVGDNCDRIPNPDQNDAEGDDVGDVCDADDDNDGICDPTIQEGTQGCEYFDGETDNCPLEWNPDQLDDDADGTGDACEVEVALAVPGDLIINEVLYDPPADEPGTPAVEGDANGDGARPDSYEDEFVEIVNRSGHAVSVEGCRLKVRTTIKLSLANTTAVPNKGAVVIFGGGNPTGEFGGAQVRKTPSIMQLGNDGSSVTLECPSGANGAFQNVASFDWDEDDGDPSNPNESLTRETQGNGQSSMVRHKTLEADVAYSPGTCPDGEPLSTCF